MGYSEPAIWDAAMHPWLLIVVEVLIHPYMIHTKSFDASCVTFNHSCDLHDPIVTLMTSKHDRQLFEGGGFGLSDACIMSHKECLRWMEQQCHAVLTTVPGVVSGETKI